jgi:acyl-CoA thioester hydrolase
MENFKHKVPIQIRFKDIDKMGHVNNANHITYVEIARIKYFEDVVKSDGQWSKETGLILARTEIDYKSPIHLHDTVFVYTRCSRIGTKSITLEFVIVREKETKEELLANGACVVVYFNYRHDKTILVPEEHKEKIMEYEGMRDSLD